MATLEREQPSAPTNPAHSEADARDREVAITSYLETLLRNAFSELIDADTSGGKLHDDAGQSLSMALEYVDELKRLGERPIAGEPRAK